MPIGTSDGQYFENIYDYHKRTSDAKEMAANETSGDFQSRFGAVETSPRMPPGASEKLTGAFESYAGGGTPGKDFPAEIGPPLISDGGQFSPGHPAVNALVDQWGKPHVDDTPPTVLFRTKAGDITDKDIDLGIGVAMSAGPSNIVKGLPKGWSVVSPSEGPTIHHSYDPVSNTFYKFDEPGAIKLNTGTGKWEKVEYTKPEQEALTKHNTPDNMFEQVPYAELQPKDYGAFKYKKDKESLHEAWVGPEGSYLKYPDGVVDYFPKGGGYKSMAESDAVHHMSKSEAKSFPDDMPKYEGPKNPLYNTVAGDVDLDLLSNKQYKDFLRTNNDYKAGKLDHAQYLDEMNEYVKYTAAGGYGKKPQTIPITEEGKFADPKIQSDYDAFWAKHDDKWEAMADKLDKEYPKASIKQEFKESVQEIKDELKGQFQAIRNKLFGVLNESKMEPKITPHSLAAERGYTQPAYRGVKTYEGNKNINPELGKHGLIYSTESPMLADMYSSYLSHHPGYKVKPGDFQEGANVMPLYIKASDYHYYDAKGKDWQTANPRAIEEAHDMKKPGVIVDNVWDEPNSTSALGKPKKIFITFPEGASTIKSRFAERFDESSKNMMHGIAATGIGGSAGYISIADEK